jgi:uncharacterized lipoprotein YddW (UPF0748 family)
MKIVSLILLLTFSNFAQTIPPKREFRAAWVASVSNIDWPTSKTLTPTQQRSEYISLINSHKLSGMNALVVQIRPSCDAFYGNSMEPWSEWLTGTQGTPPNPYYDPLTFLVDETHKRGMEFHAWFNPYRAVVSSGSSVHNSHISKTHPEWILQFGSPYKMLDPGIPAARNYVIQVILDVVKRYDIDAVHFDDYFYPYEGVGTKDSMSWRLYGGGFTNKDDWRRANVNSLITMLRDSIKYYKPWVKFGISPFGIWRNASSDPLGSQTSGFESYSGIYADSRRWVQLGWIDYIAPQIYWNIGYSVADYSILVPWWSNNSFQRHFYVGQAAYRIGSSGAWLVYTEMPNQIRLNRTFQQVKGSIFFSSKSITNNLGGFRDSLRNNLYLYPALVPRMPWKDSIPPNSPRNLLAVKDSISQTITLTWNKPTIAADGDSARYFVVYRFNHPDSINYEDPRFIKIITANDTTKFTDNISGLLNKKFIYAVTSVDRLHNESNPTVYSFFTSIKNESENIASMFQLLQNYPNPFNPKTTIEFVVGRRQLVLVSVFDVLGNKIIDLVNEIKDAGNYKVEFDASNLPTGVYYYKMLSGSSLETKKMLLMK